MNKLEQCMDRCPIIAGLPPAEQSRILGAQALHMCPENLLSGQLGPLCGLPPGEAKNIMTQEALAVSKQVVLSTV